DNASVGPLFKRGQSPCYECLAQRVARNRAIESYLLARGVTPKRLAPGTERDLLALRRVMQRARRLLAHQDDAAGSTLYTWDAGTWRRHEVVRRPQCPSCGDAALCARSVRRSWRVQRDTLGAPIASRADLVDPVTGVVTELNPYPVPALPALHVCIAATGSTRGRQRLADVLRDLRHQTSGRGATADDAVASALGEAVERYSGVWQGDEPHVRATLDSLGAAAIHPDRVLHFSHAQQRARLRHNRRAAPSARVTAPFSSSTPIDWTPVWSLMREEERWLPSSLLYYGHPESVRPGYCYADSNGCAAGPTRDAALASGLLELIERDAIAMWWYNRVKRPPVDIAAAGDPWCAAMVDAFRATQREVWALDLTNDLSVPTLAAVSRRLTGESEAILLGFGAHPDPRVALRRALGELGQMFAATATFGQADSIIEPDVQAWLTHASVHRHPYLRPAACAPRSLAAASLMTGSVPETAHLIDMLREHDFDVLVLDQTRPDIEVPVVRVVVPGLRHFWPRLGPGRLYDVPVRLGWLARARSEAELNPTAFFL
ncbi:MAG: TOMM precursor leader peptide-binding protein, partial [Gemmatimonadaceae bacterium]